MKTEIINNIIEKVTQEMDVLAAQQKAATEAATHEENMPENEHDTRAIEASYLAAGQAQRYEELRRVLSVLREFQPRKFKRDEPIAVGALVELKAENEKKIFFLAPAAGGYKIEDEGRPVQVITAESVLGKELLDKVAGDEVEVITRTARIYRVESVA